MPVLRNRLLPILDEAGDGTVDYDGQSGRLRLVERELVLGEVPPIRHIRRAVDPPQMLSIARLERAEGDVRGVGCHRVINPSGRFRKYDALTKPTI